MPVHEYLFHLFCTKADVFAYAQESIQNNILDLIINNLKYIQIIKQNVYFYILTKKC